MVSNDDDGDKWITTATCGYCGKAIWNDAIDLYHNSWWHSDNGSEYCNPRIASPVKESMEGYRA